MNCQNHPEIGEFEDECPVCSDEVSFWPVADWDNPVLRQAIGKLPKSKRPKQWYPAPVVKYDHIRKP